MFESFVIGFLLGIISMLPIFPSDDKKASFWGWLYYKIARKG